jgi:hypothetical protein
MGDIVQFALLALADMLDALVHISFWKLLIGVTLAVLAFSALPEDKRGRAIVPEF